MDIMIIMHETHMAGAPSLACGRKIRRKENLVQQKSGLQNKRVIILGGSSGIGLAVAEQAVSQGARIVIASSNAERVRKAVEGLGGNAQGQTLNLTDEQAIESLFTKVGAFDHLVFTAGDSLHLRDLANTNLKEARGAFELRYWAALAAVKYGSKNIPEGGSIVLTTGIAGQRPQKGWAVAASVCGTIEALTRALAVELAPIRVNAVSPGIVRTNLWQNMTAAEQEQMFERRGKSLPVGRVGEPYDIAQAYLFLMQEGYCTGQTLVVDGGSVLV
jgi:NAD(P)-dependent dehydrogenase (short-subunit alcohol dehydrogenase family)